MDVKIVWCVRDMRSNVRTVCMLHIVYAITMALDIGLYAHDEGTAFNFMISILHVDMKHIFATSVNRKDPRKLFQDIQSYFRGNEFHHVDRNHPY